MKIEDLKRIIADNGYPEHIVNFKYEYPNEAYCIWQTKNKGWEVYYSERGCKSGLVEFNTESEACEYLMEIIKPSDDSKLFHHTTEEKTLAKPPDGSKINLKKGSGASIEIFLPKQGMAAFNIVIFIITVIFLSMTALATWSMLKGNVHFPLLFVLLPTILLFWYVSLNMFFSQLNLITETQTIKLGKDELILIKKKLLKRKTFHFKLDDLLEVKLKPLNSNSFKTTGDVRYMSNRFQWSYGEEFIMPAIVTGSKTIHFFEEASQAEQEWVTKFIDAIIIKRQAELFNQSKLNH